MDMSLEKKLEQYYAETAGSYDATQLHDNDEHFNALMFLRGVITEKSYQSLLDVGAGTGRALTYLKTAHPYLKVIGVEPVEELRQQALNKGISSEEIVIGNGRTLPFAESSFDCVTAFGVLHHVERPDQVIAEMLRVAKRAVFISDHNVYGWGNAITRFGKQAVRKTLGFQVLKFMMTKGRGYHDTNYDGIFYPFSLFEHLSTVEASNQMSLISTKGSPIHLYSQASHIAVLGVLED